MAIGGHYYISKLGGFLIWLFKGFKGNYKNSVNHKYSAVIGFGFIFLLLLVGRLFFD